MPFLLAEILSFQGSNLFLGVGSFSKYFNDADTAVRLDAYKVSASTSEAGLVFVGKNGLADTEVTTAVNNDRLHKLNYNTYGGISNSGGTGTPSDWNYNILRDGRFQDVGGSNFAANFSEVDLDEASGYYKTKWGEKVNFENVYYIDGKIGVFLTKPGVQEVYTGPVYGKNNEILVTAYDETAKTWSTVWGAQITDPNATIGSSYTIAISHPIQVLRTIGNINRC